MSSIVMTVFLAMLLVGLYLLARQDFLTRTVKNKSVLCFALLSLLCIPVYLYYGHTPGAIAFECVAGFLLGGLCTLVPALLTKGVGGADIKIAAVLGFALGPTGILLVLVVATITAVLFAQGMRIIQGRAPKSVPFIPFYLLGTFYLAFVFVLA